MSYQKSEYNRAAYKYGVAYKELVEIVRKGKIIISKDFIAERHLPTRFFQAAVECGFITKTGVDKYNIVLNPADFIHAGNVLSKTMSRMEKNRKRQRESINRR